MSLFAFLPCAPSPFGSPCGQNLHITQTTGYFEILGLELELVLGEAPGSLPVNFRWLPFDFGT